MEQLRDVLREVLKEELAPITNRLDGIEGRLDSMEVRFDGLEGRFDGLEERFDGLEGRFDGLEGRFDGLQAQLDRMERAQAEDVVALLQVIDKKITERTDRHEYQINLLNDRLFVVEADVQKLLNK